MAFIQMGGQQNKTKSLNLRYVHTAHSPNLHILYTITNGLKVFILSHSALQALINLFSLIMDALAQRHVPTYQYILWA